MIRQYNHVQFCGVEIVKIIKLEKQGITSQLRFSHHAKNINTIN